MMRRKRRQLHELPLRVCRYGERCLVCLERIDAGEQYHDGAHGRRAHMSCAALVEEGKRREPSKAELRELDQLEQNVSRAKGELYQAGIRDRGGPDTRAAAQLVAMAEKSLERLKEGWGLPQEGSGHG